MNTTPLHPLLVHVPVALAVLMPLLSFALVGVWARGWLPRRAWWVAVALQAALVGGALAALRSGEGDEERVEKVVAEQLIKAHEEAADAFTAGAVVVLVLALGASLLPKERAAKMVAVAASVGTLAVLGLGYRVGEKGGALVYQHNAGAAWSQPGGGAASGEAPGAEASEHGSDRD